MAGRSCLLAIVLASLSFPAAAQQAPNCIKTEVADRAMAEIGEVPVAEMVQPNEAVIRVYANLESGRWTMFVIGKSSDYACLALAGEGYTRYPRNIGRGA